MQYATEHKVTTWNDGGPEYKTEGRGAMKIVADAKSLYGALSAVQDVSPKVTINAGRECCIVAFNENYIVSVFPGSRVEAAGIVALTGDALRCMLRELEGDVTLWESSGKLNICSGRQRATFPCVDPSVPQVEEIKSPPVSVPGYNDLVKRLAFACAKGDRARQVLTAIYADPQTDGTTLVASDGMRMSVCKIPVILGKFLLPARAFSLAGQLAKGHPVFVASGKTGVLLKSDGFSLWARQVNDIYPIYSAILSASAPIVEIRLAADELIGRLELLHHQSAQSVRVTVSDRDTIDMVSSTPSFNFWSSVPGVSTGQGAILLDVAMFLEAVRSFGSGQIRLSWVATDRPVVFTRDGIDYIHLLMPMISTTQTAETDGKDDL